MCSETFCFYGAATALGRLPRPAVWSSKPAKNFVQLFAGYDGKSLTSVNVSIQLEMNAGESSKAICILVPWDSQ